MSGELPGKTTYALALDGLHVPFGDAAGLADVSLVVAAGERVAVVGPSGAGKTSLLRAVAGLAAVTRGHIRVAGRDVGALPPEQRDAVYLHQSPVLFAHLSVGGNVAFPLRVRGQREHEVTSRVREALAAVRLEGFDARPVHTLSGGQRHRVALARAIAARPAALLLDEPLSALDPALRDEVREAIAAAQADYGPAMLLVTHDLDDTGLLAGRVVVLLDGRIAQVAPPAVLFIRPASLAVARFLGLFQELPGVARADGSIACALGVVPDEARRSPGTPVVVTVRAEDVRVQPAAGAPDEMVRGHVVAMRHRARGSTVQVRLERGAPALTLEAAIGTARTSWQAGDAVAVSLDPRAALVFST